MQQSIIDLIQSIRISARIDRLVVLDTEPVLVLKQQPQRLAPAFADELVEQHIPERLG